VDSLCVGFLSLASVWPIASFASLTHCCSLLRLKPTLLYTLLWLIGGSRTEVGTHYSKGRASSNFLYMVMGDISEVFCPRAVILLMLYSNVRFAKCRSVPINSLLFTYYLRYNILAKRTARVPLNVMTSMFRVQYLSLCHHMHGNTDFNRLLLIFLIRLTKYHKFLGPPPPPQIIKTCSYT